MAIEQKTLTRTLRFEVAWPGWRKTDLVPLWKELWSAQDDLRAAANRLVSALWQVHLGTLEHPVDEKKGRKVPLQSLAYQGLSGKWQPFGEPLYLPRGRAVASHVLLELAAVVHTRMQADRLEILRGQKSLPTWKSIPLGVVGQSVRVAEDGMVAIKVWGGRGSDTWLRLAPRKLDASQRSSLLTGKPGTARLVWRKPKGRKGKWMLSLAVTTPARELSPPVPLIAAVHLGMINSCTVAYVGRESGTPEKRCDVHNIPRTALRAAHRLRNERRERSATNRQEWGLREGRGRQRKLRVVETLSGRERATVDTAIRQTAAAVVSRALARGAVELVIEDLTAWSVARAMDELPDATNRARADFRRWYLRWHQGELRQRLKEAAEREGMVVRQQKISEHRIAHTCSKCGATYSAGDEVWGLLYGPKRFACKECGLRRNGDVNAALNLAALAVSE